MAFGLGFNKTKVLSTAEKYVAQGKIPAAIDEYLKLLDRDQRDLTILNTVADLCVRSGKTEEAVKRFHELAERCAEVGLIARAIATYKRITKIDQNSVQALLRLGDLYAMQGLLRDARSHYLQVVEQFHQSQEKDKARDVFEKVLMLDADNPQLQVRMAKLYAETGKTEDAVAMYCAAAERLLETEKLAEARDAVQSLQQLDAENPEVHTLLARVQMAQGEMQEAVATLTLLTEGGGDPKTLTLLFQVYDRLGERSKARDTAGKLFELHNDFSALSQISDELSARQQLSGALAIYEGAFEQLLERRSSGILIQGIRNIIDAEPSNSAALELLLRAHRTCGNTGEARDTAEQLAAIYKKRGEMERAREVYKGLLELEPSNDEHAELLQNIEVEMGIAEAPVTQQPAAVTALGPDLSLPAQEEKAPVDQLSAREDQLVKNAITEAELYKTYRQAGRAIQAIDNALLDVPGNIPLLEYLLSLCEESQHHAKASDCCEALTEAYVKLGDGERAARFGDLCLTYRQRAQESGPVADLSSDETPVFDPSISEFSVDGLESQNGSGSTQSEIREVDLSAEWASIGTGEEDQLPAENDASLVEEVEFYLQAGLTAEAESALQRLTLTNRAHASIPDFRKRLGIGDLPLESQSKPQEHRASEQHLHEQLDLQQEQSEAFEYTLDDLNAATDIVLPELAVEESIALPLEPEAPPKVTDAAVSAPTDLTNESVLENLKVSDEFAPSEEFVPSVEATFIALDEPKSAPVENDLGGELPSMDSMPLGSGFELSLDQDEIEPHGILSNAPIKKDELFAELSDEFDRAVRNAKLIPAEDHSELAAAPQQFNETDHFGGSNGHLGSPTPNALDELFREFKSQVEEPVEQGDVETHYNLGVAFKEMALYDEAIGEFQKAHQLAESSNDFSNVVQCCSLVATCFLEKGLPQLAVRWYQTALDSPGVDAESRLALLFEMASSYELAGNNEAALERFLEVYSRNIDYRDVASRIRSLQQSQ